MENVWLNGLAVNREIAEELLMKLKSDLFIEEARLVGQRVYSLSTNMQEQAHVTVHVIAEIKEQITFLEKEVL